MSKQKADRNKVVQPPPHPVQNTEIGPGRLNEQNWREIEEIIDNEETPCECVEEILNITLREVYKVYLERQLLPYTVSTAKDALLNAVEWIFLQRDESQASPILQPEWTPDIEPCCASIDNWAPSYCISPDEIVDDQSLIELVEEMQVSRSEGFRESPIDKSPPQDIIIDHVSPVLQLVEELCLLQEKSSPLQSEATEPKHKQVKKRAVSKVKRGKLVLTKTHNHNELLNKASVSRMSETLSQSDREEQRRMMEEANSLDNESQTEPKKSSRHNINRNRKGRSQVTKDVIFDEEGNIIYIIKLNPDKFPSNRVKVKYQLPGCYTGSDKTEKKRIRYKDESVQNAASSTYKTFSHGRACTSFPLESEEYCAPHFKSMVEAIDPIVGVTVRDSQQVRVGPNAPDPTRLLWVKYADKLKPITRRDSVPTPDLPEILQPTMASSKMPSLPPITQ